jgi:hypothetical protein
MIENNAVLSGLWAMRRAIMASAEAHLARDHRSMRQTPAEQSTATVDNIVGKPDPPAAKPRFFLLCASLLNLWAQKIL